MNTEMRAAVQQSLVAAKQEAEYLVRDLESRTRFVDRTGQGMTLTAVAAVVDAIVKVRRMIEEG